MGCIGLPAELEASMSASSPPPSSSSSSSYSSMPYGITMATGANHFLVIESSPWQPPRAPVPEGNHCLSCTLFVPQEISSDKDSGDDRNASAEEASNLNRKQTQGIQSLQLSMHCTGSQVATNVARPYQPQCALALPYPSLAMLA